MNQENHHVAWCYDRTFVILMLFLVLGPLGLPLLWKSPCFSRGWKWMLTILTLLWTCVLVAIIVLIVSVVMKAFAEYTAGR